MTKIVQTPASYIRAGEALLAEQMREADETNRPGCFENLAYHLSQTRWFLDRLGMKTLHDEVRDIQEQVQRERQRESEKGNDDGV